MRSLRKVVGILITILSVSILAAQEADCPVIVQEAVSIMDDSCATTGRNQACYGNGEIIALALDGETVENFEAPGDRADVTLIETMTLSGLNEALGEWGVALLQVQASLPDVLPGQNVTILLFGDVEITNDGDAMEAFFFRGGVGAPDCDQAPNGILVQTPQGQGEITLRVNAVDITLGSTAYLTADADEDLTFALIEGSATVTVDDETVTVEGGQFTTVALDEDLNPIDAPQEPQEIEGNLELPTLPYEALPRDPLADEETAEQAGNPADEESADAASGAAGEIVLLSGPWAFNPGDFVLSSGCPSMMADAFAQNAPLPTTDTIVFDGQPFSLEGFLEGNLDEALPGGEYLEPEPNVFQYTFSQEGVTFVYEITVISESSLTGLFTFDLGAAGLACVIEFPFTVDYAG